MTNDSGLFRTRLELNEAEMAWPTGGNRFSSARGDWVPLYEGKMVQAFDHRAASVLINPDNVKRPAQPMVTSLKQHQDLSWLPEPQFWVNTSQISPDRTWHLSFKHVTSPTNMRSMIAAVIPRSGAGNSLPIIDVSSDATPGALLLGCTAAEIVREIVLELTYTSHDLAQFARDLGHLDADGLVLPPFAWNEERRLVLRARLDALYFILYGVIDRNDVRYIFSTFPIVEREEKIRWGTYRSRDLTLAWLSAMQAGQPYADVHA